MLADKDHNTYIQPFAESFPYTHYDPWHPQKCEGSSWSGWRFLCWVQAVTPSRGQNDPLCLRGYQYSLSAAHATPQPVLNAEIQITHTDHDKWSSSCALIFIEPIPWGHSGPLCHALSLSALSWTSMCRRRATVPLATSGEWAWGGSQWWMGMRRLAVVNGPNIFQMLLVHLSLHSRGKMQCSLHSHSQMPAQTKYIHINYFIFSVFYSLFNPHKTSLN